MAAIFDSGLRTKQKKQGVTLQSVAPLVFQLTVFLCIFSGLLVTFQ